MDYSLAEIREVIGAQQKLDGSIDNFDPTRFDYRLESSVGFPKERHLYKGNFEHPEKVRSALVRPEVCTVRQ